MLRLSELFGRDIYTDKGEYKGKIYDIVVNLENGMLETITTEPLKVKSKQEAKKIITEKSIPYKNVMATKDIFIVTTKGKPEKEVRDVAPSKPDTSSLVKYR